MATRMAPSLLQELTNQFHGDTLNRIASSLGESPDRTATAMSSVIPSILGGLARKASTTDGASELMEFVRRNNYDSSPTLASAVGSQGGITELVSTGKSLLESVLGGRTNTISNLIASNAGIERSSASSLLGLGLPVVLGVIGRKMSTMGWNPSNLTRLLGDPTSYLKDIPSGLATALGFGGAATAVRREISETERSVASTPSYVTQPRGSSVWTWLLPLLLVAGVLGLIGYFMSRPSAPTVNVPAEPVAQQPNVPAAPAVNIETRSDLGAFVKKDLPNGPSLNIPTNGVESKLLAFIQDPSRSVDKDTWFSLDRLEFETDSSRIKPSSQEQLRNVAEILKAYPNVNLKVGGYTDNTGDPTHNLNLSQQRAIATVNALEALGVSNTRLTAEGYGEKFPVAENSTEEGKQRNRRVDVRVTQK